MRTTFCCFLLDERSHALTSYFGDQKVLVSDVSLDVGHRQIAAPNGQEVPLQFGHDRD